MEIIGSVYTFKKALMLNLLPSD